MVVSEYVQVQTAVPSRDEGLRIARSAIDARLAACAQVIGPMTSTYWWKGEVEVAEEYLVLLKTPAGRYVDLERHIQQQHSYEVAEIIALPVTGGLASYLAWMDAETQAPAA